MISSASGAVLKGSPDFQMGSTGAADAASESFMHYLAGEVGPNGVRVAALWTAGVFHGEHMAKLSMRGRDPRAAARRHSNIRGLRAGERDHRVDRERHQRRQRQLTGW
jgi:NAD(P)-dependent dehydrogenase (short-subunit alcohol dehydrogenase family)